MMGLVHMTKVADALSRESALFATLQPMEVALDILPNQDDLDLVRCCQ